MTDLGQIKGRAIIDVAVAEWGGYEPTGLTLDGGTSLVVEAASVMYGQYSRSSCLRTRLEPTAEGQ